MMAVSRVAEVLAQSETLEDLKLMHRDGLAYADHLKRYQGAHHAYHKALHSEQQWAAVPGLQGEPWAEAGSRQGRAPLHADRAPHDVDARTASFRSLQPSWTRAAASSSTQVMAGRPAARAWGVGWWILTCCCPPPPP